MLAKIITWGADRPEAIRKMVRALRETVILGVTTNIPYLLAILQHPVFIQGLTLTNFLAEHMPDWRHAPTPDDEVWLALAMHEALQGGSRYATADNGGVEPATPDPWTLINGWRNNA